MVNLDPVLVSHSGRPTCTIISLSIIKSGFKYSENIGFGTWDKSKTSLKLFSCSGWKIMYSM